MFLIGEVKSLEDTDCGGRIKVRLQNADRNTDDLSYAFPLLPKLVHIKPKVGESVMIFAPDDNPKSQRFYLGPIISQPQRIDYDEYESTANGLIGGNAEKLPSPFNNSGSWGALPTNGDIALLGRKNTDIILGDDDVRIRCGVKLLGNKLTTRVNFNKSNPSFIKLNYFETGIQAEKPCVWSKGTRKFERIESEYVESAASIVAQEINLISTNSTSPYVNVTNTDIKYPDSENKGNENISEAELKKFINTAHPLVYGDELLNFLTIFVNAFMNHTHRFHQLTPVPDDTYKALMSYNMDNLLSKHVRTN